MVLYPDDYATFDFTAINPKAKKGAKTFYANTVFQTPSGWSGLFSYYNQAGLSKEGRMSASLDEVLNYDAATAKNTSFTMLFSTGKGSPLETFLLNLDARAKEWFTENAATLGIKPAMVDECYQSFFKNPVSPDDSEKVLEAREKYGMSAKLKFPSWYTFDVDGNVSSKDKNGNLHTPLFFRLEDDVVEEVPIKALDGKALPCTYILEFNLYMINPKTFGSKINIAGAKVAKSTFKKTDPTKHLFKETEYSEDPEVECEEVVCEPEDPDEPECDPVEPVAPVKKGRKPKV